MVHKTHHKKTSRRKREREFFRVLFYSD